VRRSGAGRSDEKATPDPAHAEAVLVLSQDFIGKQGGEPFASTPEQTAVVIKEEIASYAKIIKEAGIKYQP